MSERDLLFNLSCLQKKSARKTFRKQILDEWGCCAYCGKLNPATLDHVVPRSQGGPTTRNNLIAACGDCNILKGSENWYLWFRSQEFWTEEKEDQILRWLYWRETDPFETPPDWALTVTTTA